MAKGSFVGVALALALTLSLSLSGPVVAQDEPTPESLASIAAAMVDQQAQMTRLHERIDDVRVGTIRDRIKALERAVAELSGAFAIARSTLVVSQEAQP